MGNPFDWENGLELKPHTQIKHEVVSEYLHQYMLVKSANPRWTAGKFFIAEGFCGAGMYKDNKMGSPLILMDTMKKSIGQINTHRKEQGIHKEFQLDISYFFNDNDTQAIQMLGKYIKDIGFETEKYSLFSRNFIEFLPILTNQLAQQKFKKGIIFLDQSGFTDVYIPSLEAINYQFPGVEIILYFGMDWFTRIIGKDNVEQIQKYINKMGLDIDARSFTKLKTYDKNLLWAGTKHLIFTAFKEVTKYEYIYIYISDFHIVNDDNPTGLGYMLVHFSNEWRARDKMTEVLRKKDSFGDITSDPLKRYIGYSHKYDINPTLFIQSDSISDMIVRCGVNFLAKDIKKDGVKYQDVITGVAGYGSYATEQEIKESLGVLLDSKEIDIFNANGNRVRTTKNLKKNAHICPKPQKQFLFVKDLQQNKTKKS